jgi:putative flippase GtrA
MMCRKGPFRPDARVFTLNASLSRVQEITENSILSLLILQYPSHILQYLTLNIALQQYRNIHYYTANNIAIVGIAIILQYLLQ